MKLLYTAKEIKFLNEYFKKNSGLLSEDAFLAEVKILLEKSPAMYKTAEPRYARGTNKQISGIKISSIFYFELKDVLDEDEQYYYVNKKKVKQVKQSITVHLNLR